MTGQQPGDRRHTIGGAGRWQFEDLPEQTPRHRRRSSAWWGLLVLLGVALLVAVPAGSRDRVLAGVAAPQVDLPLPAPAGCLGWDVDVTNPPTVIVADPESPLPVLAGSIRSTPCTSPHLGQVVFARRVAAIDEQTRQTCSAAAVPMRPFFPAESTSGWTTIHGDRRASMVRTGGSALDYVACVLIEVPYGLPPAIFTLSDPMAPEASAGTRWCLTEQYQAIGCEQAHTSERIGIADEPRGVPSCTDFAQRIVGASVDSATFSGSGLTIHSGMLPGPFGPTWFCDVVAPQGRQLTASVVGLGSGQLPVA